MTPLPLVLASYLVGSIPFGYLVARWRGYDILHEGSGNIGATNVGRVLGPRFGLLVFVLDFAKGAVPVLAAFWLASPEAATGSANVPREALGIAAGLAAFLGHLFPVYLRFHGGKGVATGAGVVAVLLPVPTLVALLIWVVIFSASRYVSLASLTAAATLCLVRLCIVDRPLAPANRLLTLFCFVAMALVFIRHRANIRRLLHGNENRFRSTSKMLLLTKTLHVLSLGLWFGTAMFFICATLTIFRTFEELGASEAKRPTWLPVSEDFDKDKGTQLAGVAVAPLFDWYFPLQAACAVLALGTALSWLGTDYGGAVHKVRAVILSLALGTVLVGWPVARHVAQLRVDRYSLDPAIVDAAKLTFGTWHTYSLLLNFATLLLITVAMGLAAQLPNAPSAVLPSNAKSLE
jgi:glycerol-3-phosphate acyltransferase PlsY